MMLCVISYWVLSGAKRRQIQQLRCCVLSAKLLKRRDAYLKLTRHNGRAGAHGTYNPKHNDRSFNLANSEHIDPERVKGNIYWDCFHGFRSALDPQDSDNLAATFSEIEQQFYENRYSEFIEKQNERNAKIRHVKEMLTKHSNGEIQRTIQNCITILQNDHVLADAIRLNLLSERIDIVKPVGWPRSGKTLSDTDMKYILRRMEKYGISSEKKIESAIRIVANENRYHPIRDYLNSLKWDGTERIAHVLHHFLGAAEDEYTCEAMKIFLLGAIKRVFQPGCKFETMLCLVGGQGAGKSTFFRLLAVKDEWFSDDLRRLDDDNVYRKLQGHWIIEMSEMIATANAKSIEEIKSFLSKQKETYKIPYETHPADRLRQCVFAGTTNRQDFLPRDRTGNRRFIPIPVDAELAEVHILDNEEESRAYINQLWAEALTIYNSGNYKLAFSPAMQETLQPISRTLCRRMHRLA